MHVTLWLCSAVVCLAAAGDAADPPVAAGPLDGPSPGLDKLKSTLKSTFKHGGTKGGGNAWCFKGVYDFDNCPEKLTLHECVRCCSDLATYYDQPPSKNVCLAACADKFPKLGIEWTYL